MTPSEPGKKKLDPPEQTPEQTPEAAAEVAPEPEAAAEPEVAPAPEEAPRTGLSKLFRMGRPRLTRANVLVTVLALALGFAIQTQVHSTRSTGLENMRQDELVGVLDTVSQRSLKLDAEAAQLQRQRDELAAPGSNSAAVQAAQEHLTMLGILAGTIPATGPGITLTIRDPQHVITSAVLVDAIEELRDAGAEAIQVNDVRVVASTWFDVSGAGKVTSDGKSLTAPYVITAIGDPHTLSTAMSIPGGVIESLRSQGINPSMATSTALRVTALRPAPQARYAQPGT